MLEFKGGHVEKVLDASRLRQEAIDSLMYTAVFAAGDDLRALALGAIRESARLLGIRPASIQGLYDAMDAARCPASPFPPSTSAS